MANTDSHVTVHMAARVDGFIARKDGSVDWLETPDKFVGGDTMDPESIAAFLKAIDCYVMGSRTYETAWSFEAKGFEVVVRRQTHLRRHSSRVAGYS
jgi:dihydrofolate reductase